MTEYRITYTIKRRNEGAAEFTEIGFGSTSSGTVVDDALYFMQAQVQNREWETADGMPDPSEVDR